MKIVVTGGAGMIGSNLCARLLEEGHEVVVIDNLWRGSLSNLDELLKIYSGKLEFYNYDLSSYGEWVGLFRDADCVYHLADIVAGIGYVFSNEGFIFRRNLLINCNVASACEIMKVGRYVYVGTACSFPQALQFGVGAPPLKESQQFPAHPESAYGWSKLMGELDAGYLSESSGIPSVVLVLHNVYGAPCDFASNRSQVLPALAYKALIAKGQAPGKKALEVWGDGTQGRAFVHVDDVVEALWVALFKGAGVGPMQIGPSVCTAIGDAARAIVACVDPEISLVFDATKPSGDAGRCADFSKASAELGWMPRVDFEAGLGKMVDWIRERMH